MKSHLSSEPSGFTRTSTHMKTTPFRIIARSLAVAALACAAHFSASAQSSDALKHSIPPPLTGVQVSTQFGSAVAVDGGYAVVGSLSDDTGGANSGSVKVFDPVTGALLHVLNNPRPESSAGFGCSVAISGNWLVVGADFASTATAASGTAYVYNLATATPTVPVAELTFPGAAGGDRFGSEVAIDGMKIVVAAPDNVVGSAEYAGTVYVYDLASATPTVPVQTLSNPSPDAYDRFGDSVAISGSRVVVGTPEDSDGSGVPSSGTAYVYDLTSATPWNPVLTIPNPTAVERDNFGASVAISGTRVVVGAPRDSTGADQGGAIYSFNVAGATPTTPIVTITGTTANLQYGGSVAIAGQRVVAGVPGANNGAGTAHVYDLGNASPATPIHTLNNPTADADQFGLAVAISGARVLVGAPFDDTGASNTGTAYTYDLGGATPTTAVATLFHASPSGGDQFGAAIAISGTRVVVGSPYENTGADDSGSAYVYNLATGTPGTPVVTLNNPNPSTSDRFGTAVAISALRIVVGAPADDIGAQDGGRAYVYNLATGTPSIPVLTLNNPSPETSDQFGNAAAISGTRIIIGEKSDNNGATDAGRAYVYDTTSGTPTLPVHTLANPNPAQSDNFGSAVAISGTRAVVGAPNDDTAGPNDSGAAYVYDLGGATPTVPVLTLTKPGAVLGDYFGSAVAVSGTRIAVSAYGDNTGGTDAGAVYIFDTTSPTPTVPVATLPSPSTPPTYSRFGSSISISGTRLAVAATYDDTPQGAANAGAVFLYDLGRATPTVPIQTLRKTAPRTYDNFGTGTATDGTTTAVGTPYDVQAVEGKGYAYIFDAPTTATGTPSLTSPAAGATFGSTVQVNFTLPEAALPGTVKLVFRNGATNHVLTLAASQETAGAHSFSFAPSNPTASAQIAAAPVIPEGTYSVALSYQDAVGSYAATSNVATGVVIDTAVPQISPPAGGFTPLAVIAGTPLVDYRPQAVVFDGTGIVSFTQVPAPGGNTVVGPINVTLTVTGATGPASSTAFTVNAVSAANDTDGDGMNDAAEVKWASLGFDWQVAQPGLVNTLLANANEAGLFTTSQIQALNIGTPLIARDQTTGIFKLTIGVEKSPNLVTPFAPFPMSDPQTLINGAGKLEFYFTVPGDAAFFRLQSQ